MHLQVQTQSRPQSPPAHGPATSPLWHQQGPGHGSQYIREHPLPAGRDAYCQSLQYRTSSDQPPFVRKHRPGLRLLHCRPREEYLHQLLRRPAAGSQSLIWALRALHKTNCCGNHTGTWCLGESNRPAMLPLRLFRALLWSLSYGFAT